MDKSRITFYEMELADGSKVKLALAYSLLFQLRKLKPKVYEEYNEVAMNGTKDELKHIDLIYAAYLCANIENVDECMSKEKFINLLPEEHYTIPVMTAALLYGKAKKKTDSEKPFKEEAQKKKR